VVGRVGPPIRMVTHIIGFCNVGLFF